MVTVGVLALQGDFAAHARAVERAGHRPLLVKSAGDLHAADALVLPGGESSTMLLGLRREGLLDELAGACRSGRPVLGTCAGAILLAHHVSAPEQPSLDVLDIDVERNAYGRQRDSFIATLDDAPPWLSDLEAVFIRAPVIRRTGPEVAVVARHGGHPVLVRRGPVWAATFHPEMTGDVRLLQHVLAGDGA